MKVSFHFLSKSLRFGALATLPWVLLSSVIVATPQEPSIAESEAHGFVERRLEFEQAWDEADSERRDRLRNEIRRYRNVGVPVLQQVDSARLVRWTRLLRGHGISSLPSELENWMARLEMRLVPGVRSAEDLARDPQIIVRVLAPSLPPQFCDSPELARLVLHWVDPQGQRTVARRVPVKEADFKANGFELFLQLPQSVPGLWRLEPDLVCGEGVLEGHPASFFLGTPGAFAQETTEPQGPRVRALERLGMTGFRDLRWGALGTWMGLEGQNQEPLAVEGLSGALALGWEPGADGRQRALVWVVVPGNRLLEAEFLGARGVAWRALGARGVTIVASHAPLLSSSAEDPSASTALQALAQRFEGVPKILVVRGHLARGLAVAPPTALEGFDSLVVLGARPSNAAPKAPSGPGRTLFLLPTDPWPAPELPSSQRAVVSMDPPLIMASDLPRYLMGNLDFLASQDGKPGALDVEPR
jgi:hypothetical protein